MIYNVVLKVKSDLIDEQLKKYREILIINVNIIICPGLSELKRS